jgi:hypothetical protein
MDKQTRFRLAMGILNALVYEGTAEEQEIRTAMILLDPDSNDDMEFAEQEATNIIATWADKMQRTLADLNEPTELSDDDLLPDNYADEPVDAGAPQSNHQTPCDGPDGTCPFGATHGMDCYNNCGLSADE